LSLLAAHDLSKSTQSIALHFKTEVLETVRPERYCVGEFRGPSYLAGYDESQPTTKPPPCWTG
ncbi:MAG: hypothetical protein OXO48_10300, partial [Caldilineaceae bacterium]|nr:hypothetical protein [Caldilineaceae bacterium]